MKKRFIRFQTESGDKEIDITDLKHSQIGDAIYEMVQKHDPFGAHLLQDIEGEKIGMAVVDLQQFKNPFCYKQ